MNKTWRRPGPQPLPVCAGCLPSIPPPLGTCRSDWPNLAPECPAISRGCPASCRRWPTTNTKIPKTAAWSRTSVPPFPPPDRGCLPSSGAVWRTEDAHSWIRFIWRVWVALSNADPDPENSPKWLSFSVKEVELLAAGFVTKRGTSSPEQCVRRLEAHFRQCG